MTLNCCIQQVLEKASEEYLRLVDYVQNTHAATHQQYQLEVLDVRLLFLFDYSFYTECRFNKIWRAASEENGIAMLAA